MINKLYVKGKEFLKQNYKTVGLFVLVFLLCAFPLPYYIDMPGGALKVKEKFEIENSYESKGDFHLAYVTEAKATIVSYLYALFQKDWQVLKKEEIKLDGETIKDMNFRDRLLMTESYDNATLVAYEKAGKKVEIEKEHVYVTYITKEAKTSLKNGDEILSFDQRETTSKKELLALVKEKKKGEKVSITVKRNKKKKEVIAEIIEEEGTPYIGVMVNTEKELKTDPKITYHTQKSESGPSGGLMLSLSIYNALTKKDITNGLKIVGTGTIDEEGNVGEIGGVSFKLKGAIKEGADLFIVPKGENYEEALKIKKENKYSIKIIAVSTFSEALSYLQNEGKRK